MPSSPTPDLIVAQSCLLFGFLKASFHPVALPLEICQFCSRDIGSGIAQRVLDLVPVANLSAHDQMPAVGLRFTFLRKPDSPVQDLDFNRPFGSLPERRTPPGLIGLSRNPFVDSYRFCIAGLQRIVHEDVLILVDIGKELQSYAVEGAQQLAVLSVETVEGDV